MHLHLSHYLPSYVYICFISVVLDVYHYLEYPLFLHFDALSFFRVLNDSIILFSSKGQHSRHPNHPLPFIPRKHNNSRPTPLRQPFPPYYIPPLHPSPQSSRAHTSLSTFTALSKLGYFLPSMFIRISTIVRNGDAPGGVPRNGPCEAPRSLATPQTTYTHARPASIGCKYKVSTVK